MFFFQEIVRLLLSPYPKKTLKAQQIGIRRVSLNIFREVP